MSRLTANSAFVLALVAVFPAVDAAAQSCAGAQTDVVYVTFAGCAAAEPSKPFDVKVGDEDVTMKKAKETDTFWVGTTARTFPIGTRKLKIVAGVPQALTTCDVAATPHRDDTCVALYRVKCEPVFLVDVELVPKAAPPLLTYERRSTKDTIAACERRKPASGNEAVDVDIARSESLLLKIARPKCQIPLSHNSFSKPALTLKDIPVNAVSQNASVPSDPALDAYARAALLKSVKAMTITRKSVSE